MKPVRFDRAVFDSILSGRYTPEELHTFIQLCCSLATPVIRKKIALGKLNLEIMRLKEHDIVEDCIADLFERENSPQFPHIVRYFANQEFNTDEASDERLLIALRRLVLGKVNNGIVGLYADADPTLGKILRNITLFIERSNLFVKHARFGEAYLMAASEQLCGRPPIPMECVYERFAAVASPRDTIPAMLRKLHKILVAQKEYQPIVPLVGIGVVFKEIFALGGEEEWNEPPENDEAEVIESVIESVCKQIEQRMYETYVASGKKSAEVFLCYMKAMREILIAVFVNRDDGPTYYVALARHVPRLTKAAYAQQHRIAFEHIVKRAKEETRKRLRSL
jgi:hypothetical protein